MRIGFLVVLEEQNGLSDNVQKGLGCCPYIPLTVTKYQTPLTTLFSLAHSFSAHLPGEKGLLADWYTETALAQN